ncbi:MAG: YbhB/YbcL family Raf kinase inhibitor-like protein [Deltaproteobacteria bacterium]
MNPIAAALALAGALSIPAMPGTAAQGGKMAGRLQLESHAFPHNGMIPKEHTCDGADRSPALAIRNVPPKTVSLALVVDDPDAPRGTWVHWVLWNITPGTTEIPAGSVPAGTIEGTNDFGKTGYGGPCPPSGTHRYFFKLYALDTRLPLRPGATKAQLEAAMKDHILGKAERVGRYGRK